MIKKPDCSKKIFIYHLKDKAYQNQYPKKLINKKRKKMTEAKIVPK